MTVSVLDEYESAASTVALLLQRGANVNTQTITGETALQNAAANGDTETVACLIECNADVNVVNEAGETALHWAASYGDSSMIELLLKHGALATAKTFLGETAFHWAQHKQDYDGYWHQELLSVKIPAESLGTSPKAENGPYNTQLPDGATWGVVIGIDDYDGNIINHDWCVNDAFLMKDYLLRVKRAQPNHIRTLVTSPAVADNDVPTYENIINALEATTNAASSGDSVYVSYSGHIGRAATIFPSLKGKDQTDGVLIPKDFDPRERPMRDLELDYLLRRMVEKGLLVTLILDCGNILETPRDPKKGYCHIKQFILNDIPLNANNILNFFSREELNIQGGSLAFQPDSYTIFGYSEALVLLGKDKRYGFLMHTLINLLQVGLLANASCRTIYRRLNAEMNKKIESKDRGILIFIPGNKE